MLLGLFDPMVVGPSPGFVLVKQDVVSPAMPYAFCLLGLKSLQFYCELLELVPDVK